MSIKVLKDKCIGCKICVRACPTQAVSMDGKLAVMEVASGATTTLSGEDSLVRPHWSPDGRWIAFLNMGGKQPQIELIHPDGTWRRVVREDPNLRDLAGWLPDSSALLVLVAEDDQPLYPVLERLQLATGELFPVLPGIGVAGAELSPDGAWLAYTAQEFGRYLPWVYVSRPDGSNRLLVSRLDGRWNAVSAVWSPDGRWLLLTCSLSIFHSVNPCFLAHSAVQP